MLNRNQQAKLTAGDIALYQALNLVLVDVVADITGCEAQGREKPPAGRSPEQHAAYWKHHASKAKSIRDYLVWRMAQIELKAGA